MFGLGKSGGSSHSSKPTYFDIRLKTTYKNLIVVRGSHYESPSVVLSGDLVFSLPEPATVKRVSLRLTGRFKLDFLEILEQANNTVANPVKEESVIFECTWDNLLTSKEGSIRVGTNELQSNPSLRFDTEAPLNLASRPSTPPIPTRRKLIRTHSSGLNLQLPDNGFTGTPFEGLLTPSGTQFHLPEGNYELPFECILPGNIPETVEGLQAGSILYKFEASIERSGFNRSAIMKHQYFRILRTLSSDNLSLNETISIGKSWPDKIQYEVSIPSRAIPIGGSTPINILLVPLVKGMKIGLIKAQIVQYYVFKGQGGEVYNDECVTFDSSMTQMDGHELRDKLCIDSYIKIPSNLKKITQDCDFREDIIKVRHKLKLQINLIMANGNISELRTNLPITLFISPNVEMTGRKVLLDKHGKIHFRKDEEKLFEPNNFYSRGLNEPSVPNNLVNDDDPTNPLQLCTESGNNAPPTYSNHVHDQIIFSENTSNTQSSFAAPINVGAFEINNETDQSHTVPSHDFFENIIPSTTSNGIVPPRSLSTTPHGTGPHANSQMVDNLDYKKLSTTPSYVDALENTFSVLENGFAPEYNTDTRKRKELMTLKHHTNSDMESMTSATQSDLGRSIVADADESSTDSDGIVRTHVAEPKIPNATMFNSVQPAEGTQGRTLRKLVNKQLSKLVP